MGSQRVGQNWATFTYSLTHLEIQWHFNSLVFHFCIKLIVFNALFLTQNCSVFRVDILFFSQDFRRVSHKPISSKNYIDNKYKCCLLMQIHWPNLKFHGNYWLKELPALHRTLFVSRLWYPSPASFCTPKPNLPVTPGISWLYTFVFQSPMMKRTFS